MNVSQELTDSSTRRINGQIKLKEKRLIYAEIWEIWK